MIFVIAQLFSFLRVDDMFLFTPDAQRGKVRCIFHTGSSLNSHVAACTRGLLI